MGIIQGSVICPPVRAKLAGVSTLPVNRPFMKAKILRSKFWGFKENCRGGIKVGALSNQHHARNCQTVHCSFSSSSNDNDSMAGNFNENDEEYVNSSVVEAVEVKSGADGFMIRMRDGRHLRCVHNNPQGRNLPDYARHPAIVLKMEDGSNLLLPIIVLEMPSLLVMAAVRNVQIARPTLYQIMKQMIEKMGYGVKLVRVTERVHETYFAQLYLTKMGNETESISFDLRPSDAINIAVLCKSLGASLRLMWKPKIQVPIQVNKILAYSDGMRVVEPAKLATEAPLSDGLLFTELDRPDGQPCVETKEFDFVRNMLIAAIEERYRDAAQWRDKLTQLRSKKKNWA